MRANVQRAVAGFKESVFLTPDTQEEAMHVP
jgi:hypothetical protein